MKGIGIKPEWLTEKPVKNNMTTTVYDKVYVIFVERMDLEDFNERDIDSIFASRESAIEYLESNGCRMSYKESWHGTYEVWELCKLAFPLRFTIEEFDLLGLK